MKPLLSHTSSYLFVILVIFISMACSVFSSTPVSIGSEATLATTEIPNAPTPIPTITSALAPSPTPEPPPAPTVLPIAKLYVVDVNQVSQAPSDLLEQLYLYNPGAGGGGGGGEASGSVSWVYAQSSATLPAYPRTLYWDAKGFAASPLPQALLTLPDGSKMQLDVSYGDGFASFRYEIAPGAPLGTYSLALEQGNTKLQDSMTLEMPTDPIQTQYQGNPWFMGFEPNEQVTLSLYYQEYAFEFQKPEIAAIFPNLPEFSSSMRPDEYEILVFLKQLIVTADEYGTFQIEMKSDQLTLKDERYGGRSKVVAIARGELSSLASNTPTTLLGSCGDSQPLRLAIGSTARVTDYSNPLLASKADYSTVNLQSGTTMTVVWGPICHAYSSQWEWLVDTADQIGLWVPESDANGYFLELVSP